MIQAIRLLFLCALAGSLPLSGTAAEAAAGSPVHEIRVTAQRYKFTPNVITVHQGERVRLIITALDREHGFKLSAYHINKTLKKGDPVAIEFTASKAGTFPFHCSHFCGLGHFKMRGKLIVEPKIRH